MKYELLIKDILKHTKRAGLIEEGDDLERALSIMRVSSTQSFPPSQFYLLLKFFQF